MADDAQGLIVAEVKWLPEAVPTTRPGIDETRFRSVRWILDVIFPSRLIPHFPELREALRTWVSESSKRLSGAQVYAFALVTTWAGDNDGLFRSPWR